MVGAINFSVQPLQTVTKPQAPALQRAKTLPAQAPTVQDTLQRQLKHDPRVPQAPLNLFSAFDPKEAGKANTTPQVSKANRPASIKAALEPTFKIVEAVDPEIGKALRKMDDSDFVLADDGIHDLFAKHDIYAAWVAVAREKGTAHLHFRDMVLDDRFWKMRDAEKASVIIHEMVHSKDTPVISNFEKLFGTIYNKVKGIEWGDPVEDRAYLHQNAVNQKLGITERDEIYWTVQTYLEDRGLVAPHKF
ncbi:hypothetical protein COW36_04935 [bacterium (Candidatus Blackallbacteria) CG17_big_fil_post_rev_8_21_14_2_50_48_46]|uniref:Uncharacterized protein n=1 Tax=bacterium (Candidatus Blackallbacteria) CG17_big_fil_post_rev_8_21_14_2_50_48_46 TaxID=2014261 RepID=A0A2M7G9C3_9BACT|nr:MAG: hypothetical protein COW64_04010 [bacterium (Candidatus Blackallbacteria) CG18_big_fil_WC_8_21_14_2_50_49_26]PIW18641.1 MAG: hypothetical protein COW36_04935 [bacterium (Candidatus Blackallbacteria) CG17_big_fil_post_rev_8_21_14_2_50_48_46]PIW46373.1 MAG: hypothetical protein COW20_15745 [bacterium (Candidatus Blackallbacteria) CG13_big_fil_rev_8_21_14_2_50_49_14]